MVYMQHIHARYTCNDLRYELFYRSQIVSQAMPDGCKFDISSGKSSWSGRLVWKFKMADIYTRRSRANVWSKRLLELSHLHRTFAGHTRLSLDSGMWMHICCCSMDAACHTQSHNLISVTAPLCILNMRPIVDVSS